MNTYAQRLRQYETEKRDLNRDNLSSAEYEQEVQRLVKKHKI